MIPAERYAKVRKLVKRATCKACGTLTEFEVDCRALHPCCGLPSKKAEILVSWLEQYGKPATVREIQIATKDFRPIRLLEKDLMWHWEIECLPSHDGIPVKWRYKNGEN